MKHIHWLGWKTVQAIENRIALTDDVLSWDILKLKRHAHWGVETRTGYVVLTRSEDLLHDNPQYKYVGGRTVTKKGIVTVPSVLHTGHHKTPAGHLPPDGERFEPNQRRWFAACDAMVRDPPFRVWLLTDAQREAVREAGLPSPRAGELPPDTDGAGIA